MKIKKLPRQYFTFSMVHENIVLYWAPKKPQGKNMKISFLSVRWNLRPPYTSPNPETAVVSYNIAVPKIYNKSWECIRWEVIGELQVFIHSYIKIVLHHSPTLLMHFFIYITLVAFLFCGTFIMSVLISLQS